MSYPAKWKPFLRDNFLHHEGGYVKTGSMETLFGVIDRVWVDAIDRVPQTEINAQPRPSGDMLRAIKALPKGQRMGPVREWMRMVGRETHAMNGHEQPNSGLPLQSKEYVAAGGNGPLVAASQELALGIIYRDYIKGAGIENLQVNDKMLFTVVDAFARHGTFFGYGMLGRAVVDSGVASETQLRDALVRGLDKAPIKKVTDAENRDTMGYVSSQELPRGANYRRGGRGYGYTVTASWPEMAALVNRASGPQKDLLFDAFGSWRRSYITNQDDPSIVVGDMKRIEDHHGNPSTALARIAAGKAGLVKDVGATPDDNYYPPSFLPATGENLALVQLRSDGWMNPNYEVAVQLPGLAKPLIYSLRTEERRDKDGNMKTIHVADKIISKPDGLEILWPEQKSQLNGKMHNYSDTIVAVWKTGDGKLMDIALPPRLNELAKEDNQNTWFGMNSSQFSFDRKGRLAPASSAQLKFTGPGQEMMFVPTPPISLAVLGISTLAQAASRSR